jgi:hypothetical protein
MHAKARRAQQPGDSGVDPASEAIPTLGATTPNEDNEFPQPNLNAVEQALHQKLQVIE